MTILGAFAVPHPPIIIHGVGRGEERGAQATLDAFHAVARQIATLEPELIILATPHGSLYRDAFTITSGTEAWGDLAEFRDPKDRLELHLDEGFTNALTEQASESGLAYTARPEPANKLDHGCMVPLLFIAQHLKNDFRIARIGICFEDAQAHFRMGQCVARAVATTGRRAVFVASGDLSHRLKKDGPYGFNAAGPQFDELCTRVFAAGDLAALLNFDKRLCEDAGECGLNSFIMMAGVLDGLTFSSELLSYEGPWGVGYGVASFIPQHSIPEQQDETSHQPTTQEGFLDEPDTQTSLIDQTAQSQPAKPSLPVRLAFAALADWLSGYKKPGSTTPQVAALLGDLNEDDRRVYNDLCTRCAGAFVSFHKGEDLRGCIGTISATRDTLFEEICQNTVSAAAKDPRFPAIKADEVAKLSCSVDILGDAEPVSSIEELDAKRYGVIVSKGWRRGLLLPDLDGVDTPEYQIRIALSKASISPSENYDLERFEVVRFT